MSEEKQSLSLHWLNKNFKGDPILWFVVIILALWSIFVIYSSTGALAYKKHDGNTEHFLIKQLMYVVLSIIGMWLAHKIDYRFYSKISKLALWLSVPLLIYTFFNGATLNEATRTIRILGISFQSSDLAKFALIANLASMLAKNQSNIEDIKATLIPMLLWCGVICGLIALSNLSTAVLLFGTCMLLMYIGRVPVKYLMLLIAVGIICGALGLALGQRMGTAINRIKAFSNPKEIPFQLEQSYIAIATGGFVGKGPGNSTQRNILPHPYSDMVYSTVVEEYGMLGGVVILFLYLVILYRGMITVANSERAFGGLLSAGLSFSLVLQAMVNMGVAVGLGPITGQPLPLMSMGGTSLLFTSISLGIIISVSKGEVEEF